MGLLIAWILFSLLFALIGNDKKIGYGGALLLCLLTSPILGLIICLFLENKEVIKPVKEYTCKHCKLIAKENNHYCPRCARDDDGFTLDENKLRFTKV